MRQVPSQRCTRAAQFAVRVHLESEVRPLLAGRRGGRPDAELVVCIIIAARAVTVSAATAGIAVSGVAVVICVAVERPAEGFSKIIVEFVSEVVNFVDQVEQMLWREGVRVEHRGDQQVVAAEGKAQAWPFLREFDQPCCCVRGITEAGQDRGPDVDLRPSSATVT